MLSERRMSPRAFVGMYLLWGLVGIILAGVAFGTGFLWLAPVGLIPPIGAVIYARIIQASCVYRLFPERMEVESGIVSRKIENVELFRVRDVGLRQGFLGLLTRVGDVYLHSTDSSTPDLHVKGIDAPKDFYQEVREAIAASRSQARTMIVEEGPTIAER